MWRGSQFVQLNHSILVLACQFVALFNQVFHSIWDQVGSAARITVAAGEGIPCNPACDAANRERGHVDCLPVMLRNSADGRAVVDFAMDRARHADSRETVRGRAWVLTIAFDAHIVKARAKAF